MRKITNALPLIITLIVTLATLLSFSGGWESLPESAPVPPEESASSIPESEPQTLEQSEPKTETATQSSDDTTSSSQESVTVSGKGEAAGKINEMFISPYSAKYSYNNVYMKNTSGINIDLKSELEAKLSFKVKKSSDPVVLIMHTHATESYSDELRDYYTESEAARSTDNSKNVTHRGEIIASKLKSAGFGVVHDKTQHDYPAYTGSYDRSAVTVKEYLKKYPSIKIVLDIHRDSITQNESDRVRPVAKIDGKRAAQVMLCMGSQSGAVKGHEKWRENFRLAVKLQQAFEVKYPGLARPMVLASKLYNQHLTTGSLLLEVGTESNLKSEAEYSAELVGNTLVSLLNTLG